MTDDVNAGKGLSAGIARWTMLLACAYASCRLYRMLVRVTPRLTSAEPTGAGEVLRWVRPLTREAINSIQHKTHGLGYTYEFMGCCAGLFALYGVMIWVVRGVAKPGWFAWASCALPAVFMGMLICAPAALSSDAYAYSFYGRLLEHYGVDAHLAAPAASQKDVFLGGGYYDFVPSVYGPLWTVISAGITRAGGGHVGLTLLMMRGLEAAASLGSGALIWVILRRIAPERALMGTVLFLWNPLVIVESALGGHNDACMMTLALLAVWLHLRGWRVGAVVAMTASALVKVITAPLAPLYVLMILRRPASWSQRARFLAQAMLGAGGALAISMAAAKMSPTGLLAHTASSAAFYENNYHELVFKGLRHWLGEPADTLEAPMDFETYWVATNWRAVLHEGTSNKSRDLARLRESQPLLVVSDEDSDDWLRVYDPVDRLQGYVNWDRLQVIEEPANAEDDPAVKRMSGWPPDWPTVIEANRLIRLTTWGLFVAFGLLAAWKARDTESFLTWSTGFFLASQLLVFTKIWPWYLIWPVAFAGLQPTSKGARLSVLLSAGVSISYAFLDYPGTRLDWAYEYRSIFTIVLPVVVFGFVTMIGLLGKKARRAEVGNFGESFAS